MGCSRLLTWWSKNLIIELILFTSLLRECLPIQKWLVVQTVKNLPAMQETWFQSPGWEDPLQKGMATHSSILAWRITWTEEPGGLQSMGLQRVRHNWHNTFIICISSVQFSGSVVSDSLRPHELQHARPPCPSPTPGVHSDSRPSSQWCHPAISSSVIPFSSYPQSLPASESFPMSELFAWGGQSTGVSALALFLPKYPNMWSVANRFMHKVYLLYVYM